MKIEKEIAVSVPPEKVWAFLWDVERLARCLPGCRDVRTITPGERYEALVSERVGPFKVQFPLEIQVTEVDAPRRLKAQASGRDASMGSTLRLTLDIRVEAAEGGSRLIIASEATISGALGTLGAGMIERKADGMMTEFASTIRRELEAGSG
jgi:carbon monoxide dehydrogenase subunit G